MRVKIEGLGTITANRDVLNAICVFALEAASYNNLYYNGQVPNIVKQDREFSKQIYEALDATGYYKRGEN